MTRQTKTLKIIQYTKLNISSIQRVKVAVGNLKCKYVKRFVA